LGSILPLPQAVKAVSQTVPAGGAWLHQVKLEAGAAKSIAPSAMFACSRTAVIALPSLVALLRALPSDWVIDGELVPPKGVDVNSYA